VSKSPQFFLEYIEDGIVDWDYALDARENIRNKYRNYLRKVQLLRKNLKNTKIER
jgi:hypothetical protein